jgi:hypothetical protein
MIYVPNYANALRCIAQALQSYGVDIFQLSADGDGFLVEYLDPNPPYRDILKLEFSASRIEVLDRDGETKRRRHIKSDFRFDSFPETLRAAGRYVDSKRAQLRGLKSSSAECSELEIEYQTRAGELRSEILDTSSLREIGVSMYKRRSRISNPVTLLTPRA